MRSINISTGGDLIRRAGALWEDATHAPFLEAVRQGTLPQESFQRWLIQDYKFAMGLLAYQAICVAKSPRSDHKPLLEGLAALDAELDWFAGHAGRLDLKFDTPTHKICRRYIDYLMKMAHMEPYALLVAILFGVEASYLAAWSDLKAEGPYSEFIERWSSPQFFAYVESLGQLTDRNPHPRRQEVFNEVLLQERDFWTMTWEG